MGTSGGCSESTRKFSHSASMHYVHCEARSSTTPLQAWPQLPLVLHMYWPHLPREVLHDFLCPPNFPSTFRLSYSQTKRLFNTHIRAFVWRLYCCQMNLQFVFLQTFYVSPVVVLFSCQKFYNQQSGWSRMEFPPSITTLSCCFASFVLVLS
jgi:hypothetical protein